MTKAVSCTEKRQNSFLLLRLGVKIFRFSALSAWERGTSLEESGLVKTRMGVRRSLPFIIIGCSLLRDGNSCRMMCKYQIVIIRRKTLLIIN
jgi:hypothetical protein